MKQGGLSRQIAATMAMVALGVALLVILGSYLFYYLWFTWWPNQIPQDAGLAPTAPEWIWILTTTVVSVIIAISVSVHLSRRILVPLNSVADSIRRMAQGDLSARATIAHNAPDEATRLATDFNLLADKLERATSEQNFWNAAIAHELRTPVTILRGRLQGLADGVFEPDQQQFSSLLNQIEGLSRLIEDLRIVSLEESGHLTLQMQHTVLADEVQALAALYNQSMQAAGKTLQLQLDTSPMYCDPMRIRQALLALLDNARRYASPGVVQVQTGVQDGHCYLRVTDQGPGIAADLAAQLFQAFRRAAVPTQSNPGKESGSGLGLAVVMAIAHAHGGTATCTPSAQGGSVFELRWPGTKPL